MSTLSVGRLNPFQTESAGLAVRLYRQSPESLFIEAGELNRRAQVARRPLLWVAVTHTVSALVAVLAMAQPMGGTSSASAQLVAASAVGVAAAFWAVWGWAALAPLPASVVGLVMYGSLTVAAWPIVHLPAGPALPANLPSAVYDAVGVARMLAVLLAMSVVALTFTLLGWAVVISAQARRAEAMLHERSNGLMAALSLYGLLLVIVASRHDAGVEGMVDVMRLLGFVVVAYGIAGWRTAAPAVSTVGVSWLIVGVLGGLGTFAWASIYLDVTTAAFDLPRLTGADPWVAAGYGWWGAVVASVLFPAMVEELAFRGLILPYLARLMTGGEAVLVSGALFAVLHLNPVAAPFLLPMGLALGLLRRRSGSLWPCIAMHLTHNAAVLLAERWM